MIAVSVNGAPASGLSVTNDGEFRFSMPPGEGTNLRLTLAMFGNISVHQLNTSLAYPAPIFTAFFLAGASSIPTAGGTIMLVQGQYFGVSGPRVAFDLGTPRVRDEAARCAEPYSTFSDPSRLSTGAQLRHQLVQHHLYQLHSSARFVSVSSIVCHPRALSHYLSLARRLLLVGCPRYCRRAAECIADGHLPVSVHHESVAACAAIQFEHNAHR